MLNTDIEVLPVKEIEDLDTLRIITDSQRHHILCLLIEEPLTPSEIAARLKTNRTRVYYHIDLLVKHGMIRVVSERQVLAVTERTYRAVARMFRVNRRLLAATGAKDLARVQAEILEHAADDARAATDEDILLSRSFIQLRRGDARKLREEMIALLEKYRDRSDKDGATYEVAMALFDTSGLQV
jgi:predicted ArsR family transcriptional regulator